MRFSAARCYHRFAFLLLSLAWGIRVSVRVDLSRKLRSKLALAFRVLRNALSGSAQDFPQFAFLHPLKRFAEGVSLTASHSRRLHSSLALSFPVLAMIYFRTVHFFQKFTSLLRLSTSFGTINGICVRLGLRTSVHGLRECEHGNRAINIQDFPFSPGSLVKL
jgi:hypothetical protein